MHDSLAVLLNGKQTASLRRTRSGRLELQYLDNSSSASLSISMKPRAKPHTGQVVSNWIDNLVPDDERLRSAWARDNRAASTAPFDLLATSIGEDCAGAVQFAPDAELSRLMSRGGTVDIVDESWIEARLAKLRNAADSWQNLDHSRLMYSIGGLQPKLGLHRLSDGRWAQPSGATPTTHILKPAPREEWPHLDLNEHLCLAAAGALGIASATTSYEHYGNESAVVVERFDRHCDNGAWRRLHAEDLCQALGLRPDQKVEHRGGPGISEIANLLRGNAATKEAGSRSVHRFGQALVLNWVIVGTDAHAKNYTLIHRPDGSVFLAPLYDVSSDLGHLRPLADIAELDAASMAMRMGDDYTIGSAASRNAWRGLAKALRANEDFLVDEAQRLISGFGDAVEAEISLLADDGLLRRGDQAYCGQMMTRIREWERHMAAMPVLRGRQAACSSGPSERTSAKKHSPAVQCNQRLPNGELCNRRLRHAVCPVHPTSPGSRQVQAR